MIYAAICFYPCYNDDMYANSRGNIPLLPAGQVYPALPQNRVVALGEAIYKFIGAGRMCCGVESFIVRFRISPLQVIPDGARKQQ